MNLTPTSSEKREMLKTGKALETIRAEREAAKKAANKLEHEKVAAEKAAELEALKAEQKAAYERCAKLHPLAKEEVNEEYSFNIKFVSERSENHSETEDSRWSRSGEREFSVSITYTTLEITIAKKGGDSYTWIDEYYGSVGSLNACLYGKSKSRLQEKLEAEFNTRFGVNFDCMKKQVHVAKIREKTTGKWESLVGYYAIKYLLDIESNWFGEYNGGQKMGSFCTKPALPKAEDVNFVLGAYRYQDYITVEGWTVLGDSTPEANQTGREEFDKEVGISQLRKSFSNKGYTLI